MAERAIVADKTKSCIRALEYGANSNAICAGAALGSSILNAIIIENRNSLVISSRRWIFFLLCIFLLFLVIHRDSISSATIYKSTLPSPSSSSSNVVAIDTYIVNYPFVVYFFCLWREKHLFDFIDYSYSERRVQTHTRINTCTLAKLYGCFI